MLRQDCEARCEHVPGLGTRVRWDRIALVGVPAWVWWSGRVGEADHVALGISDVVGGRWALLVVRELLFGPLRFSDLERALPGVSTNMLTDRLRELSEDGVVARRRLPPPAGVTVYELTGWGRELEPILAELGAWGLRVPRDDPGTLSPASVLLYLGGSARPDPHAEDLVLRVVMNERLFAVTMSGGEVEIRAGEPDTYDASIDCDPNTLYDLLSGAADFNAVTADGRATIDDDRSRLRMLFDAVGSDVTVNGA